MPVPVNDSLHEPGTTPIDALQDVGTDSPQELGGADSPKEAVEPPQGIVVPLRDVGATELPRDIGATEPPRDTGATEPLRDIGATDPPQDIGATELPRNEGATEPPQRAGVKERDVDTVDLP